MMVLLWSLNWSVMKMGLGVVSPLTFVLHRFVISVLSLMVLLLLLRPPRPKGPGVFRNLLIAGLLNLGNFAIMNIGLASYGSGLSAVLMYTHPLFVFSLAVAFLHVETSRAKLIGTLIGFLGVLVLFSEAGSFSTISLPAVLLIIGALVWAANTIYCKRFLNHVNAIYSNTLQTAVGIPFLAVLSFTFDKPAVYSSNYLAIVIYAGIGASTIGATVWYFLLTKENATTLASSSLIVPMLALVFGWLILGENLDIRSLIGCALVLAGIYLVNRKTRSVNGSSSLNKKEKTTQQKENHSTASH